jgi:hypothetical protein
MNSALLILGIAGNVFVIVLSFFLGLANRKPRKIKTVPILLSIVISTMALLLVIILGGLRINPLIGVPLLLFGLLLGFIRGQAVKLSWQGREVIGKNSVLFMILWGGSLAISQFAGMLGAPILASLGLIPVFFSTGLQLGYYGNLFLRRIAMNPEPGKGNLLQRVIAIGGILFLIILSGLALLIGGIFLYEDFPDLSGQETAVEVAPVSFAPTRMVNTSNPVPEITEPVVDSYLPSTGSLLIDCSAVIEEELAKEEAYPSMYDREYTLEEIFITHERWYDVSVNLEQRIVSFNYENHNVKKDWLFDAEYDDEPCPMYTDAVKTGEGEIYDDGWFSGIYSDNLDIHNCTGGGPDNGTNEFYGFVDDEIKSIVICRLPVSSWISSDKYTADIDVLRNQGKDALVENWYNADACSVCTITAVQP